MNPLQKKNVNLISQETFARIRTISETQLEEAPSSPFKTALTEPTSTEEEMEVRSYYFYIHSVLEYSRCP